MTLRRTVEVLLGTDPGGSHALNVSDLRLKFKVSRTILFEPSTAEVVVYNMKEDTRNLVQQEGAGVIIKAGYEGRGVGTIFSGVVSKASSVHQGPLWITTISATNGRPVGKVLEALTVAVSYVRGTSLAVVVADVAAALSLVAIGLENVRELTVPGNFVYGGNVRGLLRYVKQILAANQRGFFVDHNELVCFTAGVGTYTAAFLSKESGLLSVEAVVTAVEQLKTINAKKSKKKLKLQDLRKRVKFTSILLPQILPNTLVALEHTRATGLYLIEKADYEGGNDVKDPWTISAEATAP